MQPFFSYFPYKQRIEKKIVKYIKNYKNLLFVDSAPQKFGLLSGISSIIFENSNKNNIFFLAPPNNPAPSATYLSKKYYINQNDIIKKVIKILNKKNIKLNKLSFDDIMLWPKDNISTLKK